jgi:hypothetical protein
VNTLRRALSRVALLVLMLLGLPLLGVSLAGRPVAGYLSFPPGTGHVRHAPFSWVAFFAYGVFILAVLIPLTLKGARGFRNREATGRRTHPLPWWGWAGLITGIAAWLMAWTRFAWFRPFQAHTFTPLWLSFVIVVNAFSYRRKGCCLMLDRPVFFLLLFPASGLFWWFFEYLNRFVGNWSYVTIPLSGWSYFWRATPPFSTVLPAVLSACELFSGMTWIEKGFRDYVRINLPRPRIWAGAALTAAGLGLLFLGVRPDYLFSLLWISPLIILTSSQVLGGEQNVLSAIAVGDWRLVISSAAAGLFCGWFWEMWNYWSLSRWTYHIPFVHRFQVFEMPILGYAGYLPFGLECAAIGIFLDQLLKKKGGSGKKPVGRVRGAIDPEFLSSQEIMKVCDAFEASFRVIDDQVRDSVHFHDFQSLRSGLFLVDGSRGWGHQVFQPLVIDGGIFEEGPSQVPVGHDPDDMLISVNHEGCADAFVVHDFYGLPYVGTSRDDRYAIALQHDFPHLDGEPLTQAAAGMEFPEIPLAETSSIDQGHCNGIPHGQGGRGTGRGRQSHGAGLPFHSHVYNRIAHLRHCRIRAACKGYDLCAHLLQQGQDGLDFGCLSAVGQGQDDIPGSHHAEIPVYGLSGVKEEGRGAGTVQGRGDLTRHQTRFPHSRKYGPAFGLEDHLHGLLKLRAYPVYERHDALGLYLENPPSVFDNHFHFWSI